MSRKQDTRELTANLILSKMRAGKGYGVCDIANSTNYRACDVRALMVKMESDGLIVSRKWDARKHAYYLNDVPSGEQKPVTGEFEVAKPLITHRMDGSLTGYTAEFELRKSLCMTVRRYA